MIQLSSVPACTYIYHIPLYITRLRPSHIYTHTHMHARIDREHAPTHACVRTHAYARTQSTKVSEIMTSDVRVALAHESVSTTMAVMNQFQFVSYMHIYMIYTHICMHVCTFTL